MRVLTPRITGTSRKIAGAAKYATQIVRRQLCTERDCERAIKMNVVATQRERKREKVRHT